MIALTFGVEPAGALPSATATRTRELTLMNRSTRSVFRPSPRRLKVALLIETSNAYARRLLQGVVRYIREHEPWSFYLVEQGRGDAPPAWLAHWDGDGIIARIENARIAEAVSVSKLPAVDVSAGRFVPTLPWVETDDVAIANLAVEHFLNRGFKHFAYCGDPRFQWSRRREDAFLDILLRHQQSAFTYVPLSASVDEASAVVRNLAEWLVHLPKPVGVFACYDIRGQQLLDACRQVGLSVPDEVAVVGVDNDELLCDLAFPPLSSIVPNAGLAGYEVAAFLARMMRGEKVAVDETRIAPLGVHLRQSTDVLAIADREIALALRFIREHACDPIDVADLLKVVPLSRRILEKRFVKLLNHTPHAEILSVRVNRVKQLLTETQLSLEEIAERVGFDHPEYLSVVFKRLCGMTPRDFRRRARHNEANLDAIPNPAGLRTWSANGR